MGGVCCIGQSLVSFWYNVSLYSLHPRLCVYMLFMFVQYIFKYIVNTHIFSVHFTLYIQLSQHRLPYTISIFSSIHMYTIYKCCFHNCWYLIMPFALIHSAFVINHVLVIYIIIVK